MYILRIDHIPESVGMDTVAGTEAGCRDNDAGIGIGSVVHFTVTARVSWSLFNQVNSYNIIQPKTEIVFINTYLGQF